MKRAIIFSILFIAISAYGQMPVSYTIGPGQKFTDILTHSDIYRFDNFMQGREFLKNGQTASGRMNFNYLSGEMQFLGDKKDTLSLANPEGIDYIVFANSGPVFYRTADGYVEIIHQGRTYSLAEKKSYKTLNKNREGAYGQLSSSSASDLYGGFNWNGNYYNLVSKESIIIALVPELYIANTKREFMLLKKASLNKLFPDNKVILAQDLKTSAPNIGSTQDVIKLLEKLQ